MPDYDLVVLGAGATGLGAARGARRANRRVAMVEMARPGGDCTHYGCVPSKTLLDVARRVAAVRVGTDYGLSATVDVDFGQVMARVQRVVAEIERDESPALLTRQGIDLIAGSARFVGPNTVEVQLAGGGSRLLTAHRFVIATGATAAIPPIPGLREAPYLDNRTVFELTDRPAHLVVLGGGPIGCELAQAFRRLGSAVTVVEALPRLISKDEPEASRVLARVLARDGVDVRTGVAAERVTADADGVTLHGADGSTVTGSHLLVAVGRRAETAGLDLGTAGVGTDQAGRVVVDAYLRTANPAVYAAGDCASPLQFTHVGDEQGRLAATNAFAPTVAGRQVPGLASKFDTRVIPWVTYTEPEVGRVGLSEAEAFERYGEAARVGYLPMSAMDRPRCAGETDGFVKLIAAPGTVAGRPLLRGKLLLRLVGMTAVAPTGGELISEGALAMRAGTLVARLAQTVHAYPTYSLATRVAAAQFFGSYDGRGARPARPDSAT